MNMQNARAIFTLFWMIFFRSLLAFGSIFLVILSCIEVLSIASDYGIYAFLATLLVIICAGFAGFYTFIKAMDL